MKYDAVIVGGGPVGAHVADHIARAGYSVLILEEHKIAGLPVQCAGLVTTKIENLVPLKNCILNTVLGARIYSPSGHMLELDSKTPKAHVIDRTLFDQQILESAVSAGAELRLSSRVTEAKRIAFEDTEGVELKVYFDNKPTSIRTKLVIGADGANSKIREVFGFPGPKMILRGFGMEFEYRDIPKEFVQIFSGNKLAPGFFAWVIPGGDIVKIGLCIMEDKGKVQDYFNRFYKLCLSKDLVPDKKPNRTISGRIPLGVLSQTTEDNVMLVGDAAAQVKPTSGGGLYPGLTSAVLCGETAVGALEAGDLSNERLQKYHKAWRKSIGGELEKGFRLHRAFLQLSDEKLEEAFDILDKPEILEVISKKGDIESPFKLAKLLFKKAPKLIKFAGPYFKSAFH